MKEVNVYGVKVGEMDGRAGMAGLVVGDRFDPEVDFGGLQVAERLPAYAQPVFLRILPGIQVTGTFKYRKLDLVADGFDPDVVKDPLYVRGEDGYEPLTSGAMADVLSGKLRI